MGNVYQRPETKSWYLDYEDAAGRRVRKSARTTDKNVAEIRLAAAEEEVRRQRAALNPESDEFNLLSQMTLNEQLIHLRQQVAAVTQRVLALSDELEDVRRNAAISSVKMRERDQRRVTSLGRALIAMGEGLVESEEHRR